MIQAFGLNHKFIKEENKPHTKSYEFQVVSYENKNMSTKILIIEDDQVLSDVLHRKLIKENYEVYIAKDGEDGLHKIEEVAPDLILLDIVMPKKDGFEVLEELKKNKNKTPVIIVSNSGQSVEISKALALGAKDYLVKAEFDPEEVVLKVKKVLNMVGKLPMEDSEKIEKISHNTDSTTDPVAPRDPLAKTILIVEDDQFLRNLCIRKLQKEKFNVLYAVDGEEGLRKIQEEKPDLVLLDILLPGLNGFDVVAAAKSNSELSKIPIILLSNLGDKSDVNKGLSLGAEDYLIKAHFTPGEIVDKVRSWLDKK